MAAAPSSWHKPILLGTGLAEAMAWQFPEEFRSFHTSSVLTLLVTLLDPRSSLAKYLELNQDQIYQYACIQGIRSGRFMSARPPCPPGFAQGASPAGFF